MRDSHSLSRLQPEFSEFCGIFLNLSSVTQLRLYDMTDQDPVAVKWGASNAVTMILIFSITC